MTVGIFKKLVEKYNIPDDAEMYSDSGWECSETDMDGVWYNEKRNEIIFTQYGFYTCEGERNYESVGCIKGEKALEQGWKLIYYHDTIEEKYAEI